MAKKRVAVADENSVLFDTAGFSSKNQIGGSTDSAWDDGSAFPEISSIASSVSPCEKKWAVGDRTLNNALIQEIRGEVFLAKWDNGYSNWYAITDLETGYARMPVNTDKWNKNDFGETSYTSDGNQLTIFWDDSNEPPDPDDFTNLEEYEEAWKQWELNSLTSAQELVQDSASLGCNTDLTSLEPQRLMNTAQASLNCDTQELTTTATCKASPITEHSDCDQKQSTSSQLLPLVPHSPQKAIAKEPTTRETVSPQFLKLLTSTNQNSPQSKTSQVCSPVPTNLEMSVVTSGMYWGSFPPAGTMRTGLLSEADTVPLPLLEKEYCWLPSPGALSFSGKGRPPGQTKQEGGLKDLGLLQKGEVLNPDILCEWYGLPPNWLDPSELRAATELLENNERQQEICLTPELPQSPLTESSTSTHYAENQPPVTRANLQPETYIINQSESLGIVKDNLGFGFVVNWLSSSDLVTYNWERDNQQISELAIAPQHLIDKFLEEKARYEVIPENFLEETERATISTEKPKHRQRKGCLYKYLENKKLKNGTIASYPRVIGHREPSNPHHWRWGFNWEEKVDGEWKGRSIGSVPVGAVPMIQSMQREGASLEEIIGFIKRAKAKK
jgi:hypothetical protein